MLTILNESPITIAGKDVILQLVSEGDSYLEACEKCIYRDWIPDSIDNPGCCTFHGCNRYDGSFFRIKLSKL